MRHLRVILSVAGAALVLDGNVTYTEHKEYEYLLDRGDLDTVREGDEVRFVIAEGEGEKGPQASTVHPVGKHHPV